MKSLITILLSIISTVTFGQTKVVNKSLRNIDSTILYLDVPNNLQIISSDKISSLQLKINNDFVKLSGGVFIYTPTKTGTDVVQVFKHGKLQATIPFRIHTISNLKVLVANSTKNNFTKSELLARPYLSLDRPSFYYDIRCVIISFNCVIHGRASTTKFFVGQKFGRLTDEIITEIRRLDKGDSIKFEQIIFGCQDSYCPKALDSKSVVLD